MTDAKQTILGIDENEIVLKEVKRHPIGLYEIYFVTAFVFMAVLLALFVVVRQQVFELTAGTESLLAISFILVGFFVLIGGWIAAHVYKGNELVITNENVVQILREGLFDRKVSQLNLAKVQDVTVDQEGVLANVFGYGTISIESAGEAANYRFIYLPDPNAVAKQIIEAHEQYMKMYVPGHADPTRSGF